MDKLEYERAVAEGGATDGVRPSKTAAARENLEKDKRTTGDGPRPAAAAAAAVDRGRENGAWTANGRRGDGTPRDRAASSVETSGCQSNVHATTPAKPRVEFATSVTKSKKTGIPLRQLSHEVETSKSSKKKPGGCPKSRASCPTPTFIFKPKTYESKTSPANYHKDVLDDGLNDDSANLISNESVEQLPQVNTNCYSSDVDNAISDFDKVELMKNITSDEHVDEDTPCVLENPDVTLIGVCELNDELTTSSLEAESVVLLEKDPHVFGSSKESPEYSESPPPYLNCTVPVFDSNREKTDEHVDKDSPCVLENSDVTLIGERELNDEFVTSRLEAESVVLLEKPEDPVVLELSKKSPECSELQSPSSNDTVPVLDSSRESTKSLRARFEALHNDRPHDKPTQKANQISKRFENLVTTKCESCEKKVYPLEKIELESKVYHKTCFRCSYCQCLLRMDSFTRNCNRLYCMPHFKQLFKTKGSYDQGFSDNMEKLGK